MGAFRLWREIEIGNKKSKSEIRIKINDYNNDMKSLELGRYDLLALKEWAIISYIKITNLDTSTWIESQFLSTRLINHELNDPHFSCLQFRLPQFDTQSINYVKCQELDKGIIIKRAVKERKKKYVRFISILSK